MGIRVHKAMGYTLDVPSVINAERLEAVEEAWERVARNMEKAKKWVATRTERLTALQDFPYPIDHWMYETSAGPAPSAVVAATGENEETVAYILQSSATLRVGDSIDDAEARERDGMKVHIQRLSYPIFPSHGFIWKREHKPTWEEANAKAIPHYEYGAIGEYVSLAKCCPELYNWDHLRPRIPDSIMVRLLMLEDAGALTIPVADVKELLFPAVVTWWE